MITSLNVAVNDYCNSKCTMCSIWKNPRKDGFDADDVRRFLQGSDLSRTRDLSLTGGEPFMRTDLADIADAFIDGMPALERLFVNTNGTYNQRVVSFIERIAPRVPLLYGCVSIEGTPEAHNRTRGINGYDAAVSALGAITGSGRSNTRGLISMTITRNNEGRTHLEAVRKLAEQHGCEYTFRIADSSDTYYRNDDDEAWRPSEGTIDDVCAFIAEHKAEDPFMQVMLEYITTGRIPLMEGPQGLRCKAGDSFAFIDANGIVRPCIYSSRSIGSMAYGFTPAPIADLGKEEPCPCCTECTIYPMLNEVKDVP